ncbi:unnamed protein product [Acanthoscelides obtectus]|uniref:Uncharacterized protein n=2 Tax=Acanthoscelides obtectus TaxID=200917 RepID=A0A9P0VUS1_ACAOB|nr:unnamed protein product [Acanthoscelides obtectus]CAK1665304.1 Protein phosphatase 1 regulatory subunit 36 [Acanthoscelides obtectus]
MWWRGMQDCWSTCHSDKILQRGWIFSMAGERRSSYHNGVWIWDDHTNGLVYARDLKDVLHLQTSGTLGVSSQTPAPVSNFKETLGQMSQLNFRKFYQRKVKLNEKDVVTLQDIKDVAIYTYTVSHLSLEFISYFHTKAMDNYLRSLIVYFQFYFQIWNKLQARRAEGARKLRQPVVNTLEDEIRDDLSDLRAIVARNYAVLTLGIGDAKQFHHMNNRNNVSLSDKDRRIFETFVVMSERVVYVALTRKYLSLIEKELNRMLRTDNFNPIMRHQNIAYVATPEEERILLGKVCATECKLYQRSPVIQELILDQHDYRMLAIGVADMGQYDNRQNYLEIAYAAPEELLEPLGVPVGILGIPRKYFDATLKPRELSTTRRDSIMKPIPEFLIPKRKVFQETICETLPEKRCQFQETKETKENRKRQCKMWREYIENHGTLLAILTAPSEMSTSAITLSLK